MSVASALSEAVADTASRLRLERRVGAGSAMGVSKGKTILSVGQ